MTQQTINVGAAPNDGTGDPLQTAFTKSNANFTELYGITWGNGKVINAAYAELTTYTTTTATMVGGADTIPQITDGVQLLTVSITPAATTNKLRIHVSAPMTGASAPTGFWVALFRDSTAAAISAVVQHIPAGDQINSVVLDVEITAGSTSATTFRLRFGNFNGVAIALAVNGNSSARRLGGSQRLAITVLEIKA